MATVSARRIVEHEPEHIYGFLAELDNHWRLSDRYFRLEELRADRRGARISIRTPCGLRRTAWTTVTTAVAPRRFGGMAVSRGGSRARVCWTIKPSESGALVALEAAVWPAGPVDRVLLALGGRWWLRRRLDRVVAGLGSAVEQSGRAGRRRLTGARAPLGGGFRFG